MSDLRMGQTGFATYRSQVSKTNLSKNELYKTLYFYKKAKAQRSRHLSLIGAAWDIGAPEMGSSFGPYVYNRYSSLQKRTKRIIGSPLFIPPEDEQQRQLRQPRETLKVKSLCSQLAHQVSTSLKNKQQFAVIGGDHSCAIGTWHGVADALGEKQSFGMIWIDAHLDAHTPDTSISGKIHGMPLAVLLGHGDRHLVNLVAPSPVLHPEQVVIVGVRNVEPGELELIKRLGVWVYPMADIEQRGLSSVLQEALHRVTSKSEYFGISIDLDAISPLQAPGVNSPEPNGLDVKALLQALAVVQKNKGLIGVEITEFNPLKDHNHKTLHVIDNLLACLFPKQLSNIQQDFKGEAYE